MKLNLLGFRKWMIVLVLILAIGMLAACSSDNNDPEPQNDGGSPPADSSNNGGNDGKDSNASNEAEGLPEPYPISITTELDTAEPPKKDSELELAIEAATSTELDVEFLPGNYQEVINARMAAGDLAQAVFFRNPSDRIVVDGAKAGMFWEIGPYLKDYPVFLSNINPELLKTQAIDGKNYTIPRTRDYNRSGYIIRKDWLDNLGLDMPETIDDLTEIMRAFSEDDPDGNGRDDTVGLSYGRSGHFRTILMHGGNSYFTWNEDTQKMEGRISNREAHLASLNWHKYLFDNDYLNRDMFELEGVKGKDVMKRGEAGFIWATLGDVHSMQEEMKEINPDAVLDIGNIIKGPNGEIQVEAGGGTNGGYLFPKSEVETEADLKRILQFFDDISAPGTADLFEYGVEGLHHTKDEDGIPYQPDDQKALWKASAETFDEIRVTGQNETEGVMTPLREKQAKLKAEAEPHLVFMAHFGLESSTLSENAKALNNIINDADVLFIAGQITQEEWEAEMQRWFDEGGQDVLDELTEAYLNRP